MTSPVALALAFAMLGVFALVAVRWRAELVMSLPFLVILNGISLPVGGSSMRVDQLAACALMVPLIASVLIGARRLRTDSTMWWLAAILVLNVISSATNSPARTYSLLQCANVASVWIIYPIVLNFLDTREEMEAFFHRALWAAIAACAIGIVAYLLAVSGVSVGGAEVSAAAAERLTKAYGAFGAMVEPNILGGFAGAYLVVGVALLAAATGDAESVNRSRLLRGVVAFTAVALVLSFTRAAWLAAAVGLLCVGLFGRSRDVRVMRGRSRLRRLVAPLAVGAAVMIVLLLLPGDAGTLFRFKVFNLVNLGSQTVVVRLVTYVMAIQQTVDHPLIGWGTFTFAPLAAQGADFQQFDNWRNLWIGNYVLLAVHDTGLLGLGLWTGLLTSIVRRSIRTLRALRPVDPIAADRVFALFVATVVLLVAFLSTSGFSLGYPWLLIGLL
ncbi:MAG TPA: O-antigen ligase family protein, partial [Gemmatimonadaceae bacterium]|nr:O-antigen ligase family protein [Gemmatimonadaceae bacterium]